ncbi:type VII secretion target [Nocardia concava]|uniref:type VII secretion target n=1 Tax=Nocardia concava TaxID=257281 RepID=UPI000314AFC4|nr:type VII secretion target [Nocardia concava]
MNHLVATPEAIRSYGDASAAMAGAVASAAAVDQVATVAGLVPVFGLIGQDFLLSYAGAQGNHLSSVAELAAVHAGTAVTAYESAAAYEATDAASGVDFLSLSRDL